MQKRHFIELADTIKYAKGTPSEFSEAQIETLARFCKSQNGNFNADRWKSYIKGECGKTAGPSSNQP